jgi:hypothetical protein
MAGGLEVRGVGGVCGSDERVFETMEDERPCEQDGSLERVCGGAAEQIECLFEARSVFGDVGFQGILVEIETVHDLFEREQLYGDEDEEVTEAIYGLCGLCVEEAEVGLTTTDFGLVYCAKEGEYGFGRGREATVEEEKDDFEQAKLLS